MTLRKEVPSRMTYKRVSLEFEMENPTTKIAECYPRAKSAKTVVLQSTQQKTPRCVILLHARKPQLR